VNPESITSVEPVPTGTRNISHHHPGQPGVSRPDPAVFSGILRETLQNPLETAAPTIHTVRKGENLSQIVAQILKTNGTPGTLTAREIHDAVLRVAHQNHLKNVDLIHPGQRLDLSSLFSRQMNRPASLAAPPTVGKAIGPATTGLPASFPVTRAAVAMAMTMAAVPPSSTVLTSHPADPGLNPLVRKLRDIQTALSRLLPLATSTAPRATRLTPAELPKTGPIVRSVLTGMRSGTPTWSAVLSGNVTVTSDFGFRKDPFTGKRTFHEGVDLTSDPGTEVRAFATGIVTHSGWLPGYGKTVILRHADGTETLYGHCDQVHVSSGDVVAKGTALGVMGSTGRSTGNHLHFEVRRNGRAVDPLKMLLGERDYGVYYASRKVSDPVASEKTGRTNSLHRAVRGYSTLPAVTLPRSARP